MLSYRLSEHQLFKRLSAQRAGLLSEVARRPRLQSESAEFAMDASLSNAVTWTAASLTGELQVGMHVIPFALLPNPRWEELELATTRQLPEAVLGAVIAHLVDPVMRALSENLRFAAQIAAWPAQHRDRSNDVFLGLTVSAPSNHSPYHVVLAIEADETCAMFSAAFKASSVAAKSAVGHLFIRPKLVLARTRLEVEELRGLAAGDIVLVDAPKRLLSDDVHNVAVQAGTKKLASGLIRTTTLILSTLSETIENIDMTDSELDNTTETTTSRQLSLPAKVVIDMGELRVSDVTKWAVGSHITLPTTVDSDQIYLQVGSQYVGRGRLIAIGDHLGLEIIEILLG
jgi:flagellar motor switch/type III secretory pathway protein FliN